VRHFAGGGFRGKGMAVCIDKLTAVRMYDNDRGKSLQQLDGQPRA
jgi:hypothetical protein